MDATTAGCGWDAGMACDVGPCARTLLRAHVRRFTPIVTEIVCVSCGLWSVREVPRSAAVRPWLVVVHVVVSDS